MCRRNDDGEQRHRLQHDDSGGRHGVLETVCGCGLERHVAGVDGVVLAVVRLDCHVDHREPVDASFRHGVLDAGLHRRDVVARDRATDDCIDELKAAAAWQWADLQAHHCELAVTAALLLQLSFGTRLAGNGFAVRHADIRRVDPDTELAGKPFDCHRHVRVAGAAQNGLVGFLQPVDPQRWVFCL